MKIKEKILLTFLVSFTLVYLTTGFIITHYTINTLKKQITSAVNQSLISKQDLLEIYLANQKSKVQLLAKTNKSLGDLLNLSKTDLNYGKVQIDVENLLSEQVLNNYSKLDLVDKNGLLVTTSNKFKKDSRLYTAALNYSNIKSTQITDFHISDISNKIYIAIISPIFDEQTKSVIGFLVASQNADDLYKIIGDNTHLGFSGKLYLINSNMILLSPAISLRSEHILKQKVDTSGTRNCLSQGKTSSIINDNVSEYLDYRNIKVLGKGVFLPTMNWCLLSEVDSSEALSSVNRFIIIASILYLLTLLIFYIIITKLTQYLSKPFQQIRQGLKVLKTGNFNYKIENHSSDEVGELTQDFNAAIIAFQKSQEDMLQKVREQTEKINAQNQEMERDKSALLTIMEDLSKQKEKLAQEKAYDDSLLSSLGEGIIVTDKEGNILLINRQAEEMVGWKNAEVLGRKWSDQVPLEDEEGNLIPKEKRAIGKVLSQGKAVVSQGRYYVRKDKTRFPVATVASPVIFDGKVVGSIAVFRDITKEKEIDRMKTEFISLASHQLRTPLSTMKWYAELLLSGDAGKLMSEQQEFIKYIYDSNERMIDLVDGLLNISRIESGRIIVDPVPTDLGVLVKDVAKEVELKYKNKKQKLIISIHQNLPKINVDPKLIRHVYMNLLTNAHKYTPDEGEIHVFISKKAEEIVSQVSDNGYGIPKHDQAKIFQKFHRGTNILKMVTDGTGLGLYLAKVIVESSGGRIWFESHENQGTTFWFSLPLGGVAPKKGEITLS